MNTDYYPEPNTDLQPKPEIECIWNLLASEVDRLARISTDLKGKLDRLRGPVPEKDPESIPVSNYGGTLGALKGKIADFSGLNSVIEENIKALSTLIG